VATMLNEPYWSLLFNVNPGSVWTLRPSLRLQDYRSAYPWLPVDPSGAQRPIKRCYSSLSRRHCVTERLWLTNRAATSLLSHASLRALARHMFLIRFPDPLCG
jgi:hypothetical protein